MELDHVLNKHLLLLLHQLLLLVYQGIILIKLIHKGNLFVVYVLDLLLLIKLLVLLLQLLLHVIMDIS